MQEYKPMKCIKVCSALDGKLYVIPVEKIVVVGGGKIWLGDESYISISDLQERYIQALMMDDNQAIKDMSDELRAEGVVPAL